MIQILSDALAERGYASMTPVQEAVIKPELQDADLLVSAQTGSGKTVAFGLALGPTLLGEDGTLDPAVAPLALIIAPTRELALQVMRELGWLYAKASARVVSCVGGMDMRDERRALERGAHIVVGTPGRLRDHVQRGSLDLGHLRAVVLDEADEMLDMGFREDLEFLLGQAPGSRRTLMFSATVPPAIAKLAVQYQRDAVRVTTVSGDTQHADIAYEAVRVAPTDVETAIINILRYHDAGNAIVFANTRAAVSRLSARFANRGFSVVTLSGELSQSVRTHALQAMRDGRARVCVATDVAARGIDLPNLELVIHAELPSNAEGLLHRSGRTGRAGRKGTSVLIVPPKLRRKAEMLLKAARIEAEWTTPPSSDEILRRDEEQLLADPVWDEEVSEEQAAFAAKLLARHGPEAIATAYLRLYRAGRSAPEELRDPDAPSPAKDRRPFGPSAWFALSIGRDRNAEPRWLLPLILRVGRLDKDAIGAIRVQPNETFVEIAQNRASAFEATLGETAELEDGIKVRRSEGPPGPASRKAAPSKTASKLARSPSRDLADDETVPPAEPAILERGVSTPEGSPGDGGNPAKALALPASPSSQSPKRRGRPAIMEVGGTPTPADPAPQAVTRGSVRRKAESTPRVKDKERAEAAGRSGARQAKAAGKPKRFKTSANLVAGPDKSKGPQSGSRPGHGGGKPPRRGKP